MWLGRQWSRTQVCFRAILFPSSWVPTGFIINFYAVLYRRPCLILVCYIPPSSTLQFCVGQWQFSTMAQFPATPVIWLGDFNMVLNPALNRMHLSSAPLLHLPLDKVIYLRILLWRTLGVKFFNHSSVFLFLCNAFSHVPHRFYSGAQYPATSDGGARCWVSRWCRVGWGTGGHQTGFT